MDQTWMNRPRASISLNFQYFKNPLVPDTTAHPQRSEQFYFSLSEAAFPDFLAKGWPNWEAD